MKSWIAFKNILMKDMKNYYLKPPTLVGALYSLWLDPHVFPAFSNGD